MLPRPVKTECRTENDVRKRTKMICCLMLPGLPAFLPPSVDVGAASAYVDKVLISTLM